MKRLSGLAISSLALVLLAACSSAPVAPMPTGFVAKGDMLLTSDGEQAFVNKKDAANESKCVLKCLTGWRPVYAVPDDKPTGDFKIISRVEGSSQWAYQGKPLYTCPIPKLKENASAKQKKALEKRIAACEKGKKGDFMAAMP